MGKKGKSSSSLGRALIKDRFGHSKSRGLKNESLMHIADLNDGYDWGRLNLQSVTEESSFQDFLSTAQLAGTEFQAEKLNITFVNPKNAIGLLSEEEKLKVEEIQDSNKQFLHIPRRPKWDITTTPEQLRYREQEDFIEWRRKLALLQDEKDLIITPYEKNLEFWRQLWRVVERSDIVVQIVDARNPLLFYCEDLEHYVLEVNPNKMNLILVNKADYLSPEQREAWTKYFDKENIRVAFFSALLAMEEIKSEVEEEDVTSTDLNTENSQGENLTDLSLKDKASEEDDTMLSYNTQEKVTNSDNVLPDSSTKVTLNNSVSTSNNNVFNTNCISSDKCDTNLETLISGIENTNVSDICEGRKTKVEIKNSAEILTRDELISLFRNLHTGPKVMPEVTTVGLVGYPNVGKSSTINCLLMDKNVSVSATPGKTKHFQTLYLKKDILLCDCPGLVMPSFVFTKAEMVINGILPVDQLRDHVPPVTLVANLIPKHIFEEKYGLLLPVPEEGEDPDRPPTAEELLNAYGYNRGFMTQNGQPDNPRSARYILKDFVNGKLLYCCAPPGVNQNEYHTFPKKTYGVRRSLPVQASKVLKPNSMTTSELDKSFFSGSTSSAHQKGMKVPGTGVSDSDNSSKNGSSSSVSNKPWKNHQNKRNKREKLRRVYAHLDN